jgi:hypothetical protein
VANEKSSLYVRLYLDEDVHKRVAASLRLRNFDAISAHEIDRLALSDEEQLEAAASLDRALFTFNTWITFNSTSNGFMKAGNTRALSFPIRYRLAWLCVGYSTSSTE